MLAGIGVGYGKVGLRSSWIKMEEGIKGRRGRGRKERGRTPYV